MKIYKHIFPHRDTLDELNMLHSTRLQHRIAEAKTSNFLLQPPAGLLVSIDFQVFTHKKPGCFRFFPPNGFPPRLVQATHIYGKPVWHEALKWGVTKALAGSQMSAKMRKKAYSPAHPNITSKNSTWYNDYCVYSMPEEHENHSVLVQSVDLFWPANAGMNWTKEIDGQCLRV